MTVAQALHWYGAEHAPTTRSPWRVAYAIEALSPLLGPAPLQKVTANVRRRYVKDREAAGRSVATARKELGVLDAAARHCVREGYLTHYPDDQWLPDAPPPRERWLTESEAARLLWHARKDARCRLHLPLFILTALYTGRRREAILSLQWQPNTQGGWVDLERGVIDFRPIGRNETKKKRGSIPIPRRLLTFLRLARKRTTQYVFEFRGSPVRDVKKSLATAGKNAGLAHIHPHLLKHTAVTWLARRGVPMEDVSIYTETTVETLRRVYRQHAPDMHNRVLQAFK